MAVRLEALKSRRNSTQSNFFYRIPVCFALLLLCLIGGWIGGWGDEARADGVAPLTDNWITINKDYSGQRYVDLDQITPRNVDSLKEVCEIRLNEPNLFSSGLLKVGRTLYVGTSRFTYAFDAATCALRWRYVVDFKQTPAAVTGRGAGYLDGKIFRGTTDGRVIALNANTGQMRWDVQAADPTKAESFVSAPIAWQGKVFNRDRYQRFRHSRSADGLRCQHRQPAVEV